jgi:hypothetical protein
LETEKNAINAIADRGWNPLNFNILTTLPATTKNMVDLTIDGGSNIISTTNTTSTSGFRISLPEVNIKNDAGSYYLDQLIEEEKRSEGRFFF